MGLLRRQSIKSSIATYIGIAIGYVNLILLFPKFLLPDQLGLTRVMISMAAIFSQLALIGTPYALMRFFPYLKNKEKHHYGFPALMLRIALIGFAVVSTVFLIFQNEIQNIFEQRSPLFSHYFLSVFPMALFMLLTEFCYNYFRSLLKLPVPVFIKEVMIRLLQTAALVIYILDVVDFYGFIILFIATYFLQVLLMIGYVFFLKEFFFFSGINHEKIISFRQILRFSLFAFASSGVAIYTANIDTVLLGILADLQSVAIYSVAFFIGTVIQIPARSMNVIATSLLADAWRRNDQKKIQQLYVQTSLNQLIIGGFLFLLIWVNVNLLLSFLPPVYSGTKWVIFIVGLGKLFDMATGVNGEIISVSRHVKVSLITNLFLIIITTLANYLLIPVYGVHGAAVATAISLLVYNGIRMIFLFYEYRLQPFNVNTLKAALLLLLCFGLYYILPAANNIWLDGMYRSAVLSALFIFPLLLLRISPEINEAYHHILDFFLRRHRQIE